MKTAAFFQRLNYVLGLDTPGPGFVGLLRERARRSLTCHSQGSDPPWGVRFSTAKRESRPRQSGLPCPKAVPWRGGRADLRAAGGARAGASWAKAAHPGACGLPGLWRAKLPGGQPGPFRARAGAFSGVHRAKTGRRRGKTGRSGALRGRVRRALGAKKPLFAAKRAGNGAVLGRNWRRKLAGRVGLFGTFRESSGGFGGKGGGFEKAFPRAYRKELPFAPFLCRWRTVIGAINLVDRSGCYLGRKE